MSSTAAIHEPQLDKKNKNREKKSEIKEQHLAAELAVESAVRVAALRTTTENQTKLPEIYLTYLCKPFI